MSDEHSISNGWSVQSFKRWFSTVQQPNTREDLVPLIQDSQRYLEADTVKMLEGVLDLPATQVKEIMTPRPNIVAINETDQLDEIMDIVLETSHSRYPVIDNKDNNAILGILLAKDLVPILFNMIRSKETQSKPVLKDLIRKPVYINENARSDSLLRDIQKTQVHMAVVVDEFGNMAGIVTMEDLLEEIVGEIIDEHDCLETDTNANNIVQDVQKENTWQLQSSTPIDDCNEILNSQFDDSEVDTIGGLVMQEVGEVGKLDGESFTIDNWQFTVLEADGRFIKLIEITRLSEQPDPK